MISPFQPSPQGRRRALASKAFGVLCFSAGLIAVASLVTLMVTLLIDGLPGVSWSFLTSPRSALAHRAGILQALAGSALLLVLTAAVVVPVGIAAAVYLEEFVTKRNRLTELIEVNIANLSGVPSIVYGMLGLAVFVLALNLGRTVLAGALTLGLLVLPMVILVSREALKAVPQSYRDGSLAVGASRWKVIWTMVLPNAFPGILTGIILSLSRAVGETAPLIVVGAATLVTGMPTLDSNYTALPITIFSWATDARRDFQDLSASGIVVIMAFLLIVNGLAIALRARQESRLRA
jgi:phosphate transport system permease protein